MRPVSLAPSRVASLGWTIAMLALGLTSAAGADSSGGPIPSNMVLIPSGSFVMGIDAAPDKAPAQLTARSTARERLTKAPWSAEAFHDEGPAHLVTLDAYLIDKYEVSNRDFGVFIKATGHPAPAYWDDPRVNKPEQPVVGVNWYDATAYCEWSGKRLPREAEWEKAARGPFGNRYPWGNDFDAKKVNFGKHRNETLPVDGLPEGASYYGLHHMAGNVFEWVADWYDPDYYASGEGVRNPRGPRQPVWLGETGTFVDRLTVGAKRVIRGGSWIAAESSVTTTHRFWNDPMNNSYGVGLGFRCAMDAPADIERQVRGLYISALVSMGKEQHAQAQSFVDQGLAIDPTNRDLLQLRTVLRAGTAAPTSR